MFVLGQSYFGAQITEVDCPGVIVERSQIDSILPG